MSIQRPIVNAGHNYIFNFRVFHINDTSIGTNTGQARDSTNTIDMVIGSQLFMRITDVGVNGLDVGVVEADTLYAVYVIGDSTRANAPAGLISKSFNAPKLPTGYDSHRRLGTLRTDGGSLILPFCQVGFGHQRYTYYMEPISVLAAGLSTAVADVDISAYVPPLSAGVLIADLLYTPAGATEVAHLRGYNVSAALEAPVKFGTGVLGAQRANQLVPWEIKSGLPNIQYFLDGGSLDINVAGFVDEI